MTWSPNSSGKSQQTKPSCAANSSILSSARWAGMSLTASKSATKSAYWWMKPGRKSRSAPDYGFRVDGATRFFVETKPPTVNLKHDSTPAFQLRRYGWSGNKPVSILTDFEEFAVYDCRVKPQRSDPASKARLRYYRYGEYIENWNDIAERFSRQAVIDGALQRWIGGTVTRGVVGVDEAFLREMEGWRENLARDIALHNDSLNRRDLNLLVQRAIDRIVFLRIAEDRGIESYGRLRSAVAPGRQAYSEIKRLFHEADDKYNSGLFDFRADALSLQIHISDEALRGIISQLYYPESPYEFSAIPGRYPGASLRTLPGQGHPAKLGGRRAHRRKARSAQSRAASITRPRQSSITSSRTPSARCWMAHRPKLRRHCVSSTRPVAAALSSMAPINTCWIGIWTPTAKIRSAIATASARRPMA